MLSSKKYKSKTAANNQIDNKCECFKIKFQNQINTLVGFPAL